MKNTFLLVFILSFFSWISCTKDSDNNELNTENRDSRLIGSWKYEESTSISFNTIFVLNFNADGSGSEVIITKHLSTGQQTVDSNTPFTWSTVSSNGELNFLIAGNTQKTTYSFFVPNTQLIIKSYSTVAPHFVKQ